MIAQRRRPHTNRIIPWVATIMLLAIMPSPAQDSTANLLDQTVANAVATIAPSVVRIERIGGGLSTSGNSAPGPTTGLVIGAEGYVLASAHAFSSTTAGIVIQLDSGEKIPGQIVARDFSRNIILLKCDPPNRLPEPMLVQRDELQVGQTTIAIGRGYSSDQANVSTGILSAKARIWNRAVQTDAKISSANFGGPLIDLTGRVIGILVPLSPDSEDVGAGSQWYDSGIGFAVPLSPILEKLDRLKQGIDLYRGKLGIAFKGSNIYAEGAEIIFVADGGPAAKAGLKKGDLVIQVNGQTVRRQADFKHLIGPLYATDGVDVLVRRGETEIPLRVELVQEVAAYQQPSLGILAGAHESGEGVLIRAVTPNGPAAVAGLQAGEVILEFQNLPLENRESLSQAMAQVSVSASVELKVSTADGLQTRRVQISTVPKTCEFLELEDRPSEMNGVTEIELLSPEFKNKCLALVPENPTSPPSVLVWIPQPGAVDRDRWIKNWSASAAQYNVALLVPSSADSNKWTPSESDFITKSIGLLENQLPVNSRQVAIGGSETGASMAAWTCFQERERFSGLIMVDAILPRRLPNVRTMAMHPLSVLLMTSARFSRSEELETASKRLREEHFPIAKEKVKHSKPKEFSSRILQWVDTLDRF